MNVINLQMYLRAAYMKDDGYTVTFTNTDTFYDDKSGTKVGGGTPATSGIDKDYTDTTDSLASYNDPKINFSAPTTIPSGYENPSFKEWNTKADGTGTKVTTLNDVITSATADANGKYPVYAIWAVTKKAATLSYDVTYYNTDYCYDSGNKKVAGSAAAGSGKKITYHADSGDVAKNTDEEISMTAPTSTPAGYDVASFKGWNTNADGTGAWVTDLSKVYNGSSKPDNGGKYSLYAIWTVNVQTYSIKYNPGKHATGSYISDYQVPGFSNQALASYNDVKSSFNPASGYAFAGWGISDNTTSYVTKANQVATSVSKGVPLQVYAIWEKTTYTVNFKDSDGNKDLPNTEMSTKTAEYDPTAAQVAVPGNRTGYTFDGWALDTSTGTKVANASGVLQSWSGKKGQTYTFAAIWKADTYTINWYAKYGDNTLLGTSTLAYDSTTTLASTFGSAKVGSDAKATASFRTNYASGSTYSEELGSGAAKVKYTWSGWYLTKSGNSWKGATGKTALVSQTLADIIGGKVDNASLDTNNHTVNVYGVWTSAGAVAVRYHTNPPDGTSDSVTKTGYVINGGDYTVGSDTSNWKPGYGGYTFSRWNTAKDGKGTYSYHNGDLILGVTSDQDLYAQYDPNELAITLDANTSEKTTLNDRTSLTFHTGDTVKEGDLTSATPTRDGYEFKGWATSESGPVVVVGPTDSDATWKLSGTDVPNAKSKRTLYAQWSQLTYTVQYNANGTNVTFAKPTGITVDSPYNKYKPAAAPSETGWNSPDITAKRRYYDFKGWATSATAAATDCLNGTEKLLDLYNAQGGTNRVLNLYAIWESFKVTVNYISRDMSNGKVINNNETVDLATGTSTKGSTATATTAGYIVDTWTDGTGNTITGSVASASDAKIQPTIDELRALATSDNGTEQKATTLAFGANFKKDKIAFTVKAYFQKDDGAYATDKPHTYINAGDVALKAELGSSVAYTYEVASGTLTGKKLWELALQETVNGQKASDLYELDTAKSPALNINEIYADATKNVMVLYYKRLTFDLNVQFQTKDEEGKVTPRTTLVSAAPASFVHGGDKDGTQAGDGKTVALRGVRWGQSVTLDDPSTGVTGYTFSWDESSPSTVQIGASGKWSLSAAEMASLATSGTKDKAATILGTFAVQTFWVTLEDTSLDSSHNWTSLLSEAKTSDRKQVAANKQLDPWVPDANDTSSATHYFAGWYDKKYDKIDDAKQHLISSEDLNKNMPTWTSDMTYVAMWLPKMVVTYTSTQKDTYGTPIATWKSDSVTLSGDDVGTDQYVGTGKGRFDRVIGSSYLDDSKNPAAIAGWEFDYWTVTGGSFSDTYGHSSDTTGFGYFADGTGASGFALSSSYTFTAHWKAKQQTVTILGSGKVRNNAENDEVVSVKVPFTGSDGKTTDTYHTDDTVNLTKYTPTAPAGYDFMGWTDDPTGKPTTVVYAPNATMPKGIKDGGLTLAPVFDEKTVTFTYVADPSDKGKVDFTTSDTVYAVKHNGINDHTASSRNQAAYQFDNWTYGTSTTYKDAKLTPALMAIPPTEVLEANRTYTAHFSTRQYTVTFSPDGTDGTNDMGKVAVVAGKAGVSTTGNSYKVDYNGNIPADGIKVEVPLGYKLAGWLVDTGTTESTWSPATEANYQGVYSMPVTTDVKLTAKFKVSDSWDFLVNYVYDQGGVSGFSSLDTSRKVAWGDSGADLKPGSFSTKDPAKPGYEFKGWFTDESLEQPMNGFTFGEIYQGVKDSKPFKRTGNGKDPSNVPYITLYGKWEAKPYTVAYDVYGNVPDDAATHLDDVTYPSNLDTPASTTWGIKAKEFLPTKGSVTRGGYKLDGWTVQATKTGAGTTDTVRWPSHADGEDTYGFLAGNDQDNSSITLVAHWSPVAYKVLYQYDGATDSTGAVIGDQTVDRYWAGTSADVDYYNDPRTLSAPYWDGHSFNGWSVKYTTSAGEQNPAKISASKVTCLRDLRGGDSSTIDTVKPALILRANWLEDSSYTFVDVLVDVNGNEVHKYPAPLPNKLTGTNRTVNLTDKYTFNTHDGYDFDNYNQVVTGHPAHTSKQVTIDPGAKYKWYVYYVERSYEIDYHKDKGDGTVWTYTQGNAWDSTAAKIPTDASDNALEPTKTGYTFGGWYTTVGGSEVEITGTNTLKTILGGTAPAVPHVVEAYAQWDKIDVTVSWQAGSNGHLRSGDGSTTGLHATDTSTTVAPITAEPDSDSYEFSRWTYSYTDENGYLQSGDVSSSSPFAKLSSDGATLTPIVWTTDSLWHNIAFTAEFAPSGSLSVTVFHYYEDPNHDDNDDEQTSSNPNGRWVLKETSTYTGATQGVADSTSFTAPALATANPGDKLYGYTLDPNVTGISGKANKQTKTVLASDAETRVIYLYYTANQYLATFRYVNSDGTDQTDLPSGATGLIAALGGTYKTGQNVKVPADKNITHWTFDGWHVTTLTGTDVSGTADATYPMPAGGVTFVGNWSRQTHTVKFSMLGGSDPASVAGCDVNALSSLTVNEGSAVRTAVTPDAATLADLGVSYSAYGKPFSFAGWYVYQNGNPVKVDAKTGTATQVTQAQSLIGITDPLSFLVNDDTVFYAAWSDTYNVQYTRGLHGDFTSTDKNGNIVTVDSHEGVVENAVLATDVAYAGTKDATGNPTAEAGWEWAGWGVYDDTSKSWTYYFLYDDLVDYGTTVTGYTAGSLTGYKVTHDVVFQGFWRSLERKLQYCLTEYDGTIAGKEYTPKATWKGSPDTYQTVHTGDTPTLLGKTDIDRDGYELTGWTYDGTATNTFTPGSKDFKIPEVASAISGDTVVYLYPVFSLKALSITYKVDDACKTPSDWGTLGRTSDSNSGGKTIQGSTPKANDGYEFVCWKKDGDTNPIIDATYDKTTHKLTPTASGTYVAVFKQKDYKFATDKGVVETATDTVTMPTGTQVSETQATPLHWTDTLDLAAYGKPTRAGYTFKGWDTYAAGDWDTAAHAAKAGKTALRQGIKGDALVSALSDAKGTATEIVLVATWDEVSDFQVEFDKNAGSDAVTDMPANQPSLKWGSPVDLKAKDGSAYKAPARAGFTFQGWTVYSDAAHATVLGGTDTTPVTANSDVYSTLAVSDANKHLYLVANWHEVDDYQVEFDKNAGTDTVTDMPANQTDLKWGSAVDLMAKDGTTYKGDPARDGYDFQGWTVYSDAAHTTVLGGTDTAHVKSTSSLYKNLAVSDANKHLYLVANWTKATLGVEYHLSGKGIWVADGSKYPSGDPMNTTYAAGKEEDKFNAQIGDTINLRGTDTVTYAGHTLLGWSAKPGATTPDAAYDLASKTSFSMPGKSVVLYAVWEDKTGYEVTFQANDSTDEPVTAGTMPADVSKADNLKFADTVATKVVVSGAAVDPERPGYTFLGWTVYADAAHTKVVNNTDQAANYLKGASYAYSALTNNDDLSHVWLVANWQDKGSDYKVTYDANDSDGATKVTASTMPAAWTGKFHGTGVKLDAPTRKGYTFLYWESSVTGNPHVSASSTATSYDALAGKDTVSSVVLKAIWKAEEIFNVVYNDGGAGTDLTSALPKGRANITFDAKDVKMDAQTRTGFSFAGWQAYDTTTVTDLAKAPKLGSVIKTYTDAVYSALAGGDDKVTTITLVAQWLGNKHYLTYDKGDASAVWSTTASYYPADDPVADGTYTTSEQGKAIETAYNASINLRGASTLALTGKTLIGWQTKDGATKYYLSDAPDGVATVASFTMPDKDLVLVPIWKVASGYSVTFLDRPASDKGTDAVTDMPVSPQSNLAWPGNVDLQAKDGSAYKGAPVRVGYTFEGWEIQDSKGVTLGSTSKTDTNAAFNDLADNKDTADRKALVLVARWTAVSDYNVVFKANDGVAGDGTTKVTAGTMPADRSNIVYATTGIDVSDPTRPGYIFEGWTSSVSGADVAAGTATADYATLAGGKDVKTVTLTAKWKADETYSVTYDDGVPSGETGLDTATPLPAPRANIGYDAKDVKVSELKRDGYEFKGWDVYETADMNNWLGDITSAYATDRVYSALANSASVKGITLVAKWEAATNKVTYHLTSGQGTWSADTSKYPAKDKGAASPADPTGYQTGEKVYLRGGATIDRPGYTLRGWSKTAPADPLTATPDYDTTISYFTMPAGDMDLYPVWTAVKYRVTFKDKDASDTDSANAVTGLPSGLSSINYDDSVVAGSATEPKAPTRPGYDFAGWVVTDDNAGNAVLGGTDTTHVGAGTYTYAQLAKDPSVRAITLTAQWTKQQFEVRYYNINSTGSAEPLWTGTATDGGVLRADGSVSVAYETGDAVALREASTVSWAGHTLKGWATGTDKTATGYTEYLFDGSGKAGFTMPADNVYLYPIWDEAKDYAVKYVANQPTVADGAVVGKSVTGMPTDKSGLSWTTLVSTAHPAFAGFKFLGWVVTGIDNQVAGGYDGNNPYTGSDAFFNVLAGNKDTAAHKTLTLTAKWALDLVYNVIFKDGVPTGETAVDAGTMPAPQKGIAYTAKVDHTAPTRAGYKFTGWTVVDVTDPDNTHSLADRKGGTTSYYVLTGTPDFPSYKTLEMTANWQKRNDYNVHFVAGDGTTGDGLTKVTAVTMPTDALGIAWDDWFGADAPTREGYTFLGWDVKNTTGGASDQISDPKTPATAGKYQYSKVAYNVTAKKYDDTYTDLTFTALWKALSHDVTYVISGFADASWVKANITDKGKNAPDAAIAYDMDDSVILRGATTVTRNGYTLTGWANGTDATAAGYKEYVFANGDTAFAMPNADVKLYPLWTGKTYQVTYDANTGALSLTDPSQVVSGLHDPNPITGLSWTSDVPVDALTLPGYKFLGWVVKDAKETGALTGTLTKAAYTYDELARTDTAAHAALTLVAQWEQATYRLIYVDPVDADGAAAATPVQISNDATKHWGDKVDATTNPITGKAPWYTGKSDDDWQFDGWQVYDAATSSYVTLTADQLYSYLADVENLTLADVAGATDDPAVILYASWTRRVPFVVDFVKRPTAGTEKVESSTTLKGLDGDDIATKWASEVLDLGDKHAIAGYAYNRLSSTPGIVGTLVAGADELHLKLYYDPTQDYLVTYDATPGKNAAGKTSANAASPAWETSDASFAPVDSDWYYQGHKIDHWFYKGADGKDHTFDATDGRTFADIAAIIYGKVDGSEGRDADGDGVVDAKPVTLYAYWVERDDYKVVYNDNYDPSFDNDVEDKFLGRVKDATYTPADRQNVTWSSTAIQPTDTTGTIKEPGVTGGMALYEQDGWNYSTDGGLTQHPAEGMSFAQIAQAMFGTSEPDAGTIVLYARWKQVDIKLTYTPVIATVDADGKFQAVTGTKAGGTVSRASETVSAISGGTLTGSDLKAAGATATAGRGYHFIGWRRVSDGTVVYAPGYDPASLSTMSLTAMSDGTGFNVLPDGTIDGGTIFSVAQNASDGYWHSEEYQALFVENDPAVLHYDKNADDATGTIADVTKPYGTLIKLDSGTEDATADTTDGFKRAHWKLTGWNTKADGTGTPYALSQADWEMPKGETTLYAMWEKISGRLIYDKNATDATGTIADVVKQGGTVITLDSGTEDTTADTTDGFHRKHYVLVGWNTKADYTGTHYDLSESGWVMPDGTTTLYAEWQKAKYEISGPEGTDVVIPDGGDGTKTDGGTTGGTTGTKIDGGYIKGGDVTKIEYGEPVPAGWIEAIPEDGKHVDHWTYVWTDEDGTVHTETADDPTKFTVKGNGTISPVFVDDAAEEPETPVTPATPAEPSAPTTTAAAHTAPAAGETIPQTSDTFDALLPLTAAGLGLLLILLAFVTRRRDDEEAE